MPHKHSQQHPRQHRRGKMRFPSASTAYRVRGGLTYSSLIEYGLPICALKERSRQKHRIHVLSRLRISRSRARPSGVSGLADVERRCRFKSVPILKGSRSDEVTSNLWGKRNKRGSRHASNPVLRVYQTKEETKIVPMPDRVSRQARMRRVRDNSKVPT